MAQQRDGDMLRGDVLAQTCNDLLANISHLEESQLSEMQDVRAHLEAMRELLRRLQPLEGRTWTQVILDECRNAFGQLSMAAENGSSNSVSEPVRNEMSQKAQAVKDLVHVRNKLSLASNLSLCNEDLKDGVMIETVHEGLDAISQELMGSANVIMPYTFLREGHKTFELREATLTDHGTESTHKIICSNCSFHEIASVASTRSMRFACLCPSDEGSHDGELSYQVLPATFVVEHLRPIQTREWHMVLSRPRDDSIVSIIISETQKTGMPHRTITLRFENALIV
ncbi:hypothetical protein PFICI_05407 [Pestalotiopsis fici W106-1]|uniref:Uncharacterized protein n=1 Tax=Pestalotiopsis fici (strain W106-1 / CGMCC3.15140) TaxID=1229662 RepID=W3XEA1_PESFW|nr:uncharacterized protein PFICI_05407 [Pestalotiopsis fici W106-1]ETS83531.1 hypothetical protein PFICI_05407 [Pestalotiopsis fici W106-1]